MSDAIGPKRKEMEKAIEHLKTELSRLRVGRATTSMVEGVKVDVYGSAMTLKEVAALGIPDAKTITVTPWDRGVIGEIEKGIHAANLGLTPINDGKMVRINLPPLTEDRRKDFVKHIKKCGEETKVAVRNIRRDAMEALKSLKEKGEVSEDALKRSQDEMQKLTDHFVQEADRIVDSKSKEIMTL
ncbi:MAG: ribosome recycling factor [Deltaproteobacteria bacterium]|nr:ribosome recycling factor [Deltaproteobacteria bacterium]MBI3293179.1 ribosome recycling factor [Deltaproteobacteria bacterium]